MAHSWKVGAPVVVTADMNRSGGGAFTIAKVGRKYFSVVERGRSRMFSLTDGREQTDGVGGYRYAHTPEQHAELTRRKAAAVELRELTSGYDWTRHLTTAQMESAIAVLRGAK